MELRTYANLLLRYIWMILLIALIAGVAAGVVDYMRQPVYQSQVRVALRPATNVTEPNALANMMQSLGGRYVPGTFAEAFTSASVIAEAQGAVPQARDTAYSVSVNVLPDTSVLEVRGTGPDPAVLAAYVNAIVAAGIKNPQGLFRGVDLVALEQTRPSTKPISPTPYRDIPLAAGLGLGVGILLALAALYFRGVDRQVALIPAQAPHSESAVSLNRR
jgi:capsular polysaccharide biosynthesis protein